MRTVEADAVAALRLMLAGKSYPVAVEETTLDRRRREKIRQTLVFMGYVAPDKASMWMRVTDKGRELVDAKA